MKNKYMVPDLLPEIRRTKSLTGETQIIFDSGTAATLIRTENFKRFTETNLEETPRLVLLSGVSESGKSTLGNFGVESGKANRIKIYKVIANLQEANKLPAIMLPPEKRVHGFTYDPLAVATLIGENSEMQSEAGRFVEEEILKFHGQTDVLVDIVEAIKHPWIIQGLRSSNNLRTVSIFVEAPDELRVSREAQKLQISKEEVVKRIAEKDLWKDSMGNRVVREQADMIIDNKGSIEDYIELVDSLLSLANAYVTPHSGNTLELS